jgi:acetyl-CoA C-acetyltransferase
MADAVVIVGAARTPVGAFNGTLAGTPAHELGKVAIQAALKRAGVEPGQVSELIFGQVLTAAQGMNPARQASKAAGLPNETPAWLVNQVCGSGLRTVALGYQSIMNGDSDIVVAGGQESMSQSVHASHLRAGHRMGDVKFIDTMIKDGLWDVFNGYHMGGTAENVAKQWQITREMQDQFAVASQNKAEAAKKAGKFKDEIAPVTIASKKGDIVFDTDEYIRDGATIDAMAKLKPAFDKEGTVTAANASGINDGAAALVLMKESEAKKQNKKILARIASWAQAGVDPSIMGTGPIPASRAALKGRLECAGSRSGRSQRGLRRAGLCREQRHGLGYVQGQRERWRHRHRSSDRRFGRTRAGDAAPRNGAPRRQEGPFHALHRRRHGDRPVR